MARDSIDHIIETLSIEQAKIVKEDGGTTKNALQAMAHKGDCEAVSHLLELGADINNLSGDYGTPMMAAASNGKLEMLHLLIERGADVNKKDDRKDKSGRSAIDVAVAHRREIVIRALLDEGAVLTHDSVHRIYYTPLQILSRVAGSANLARLLLENGASVDGVSSLQPETPLFIAAEYGDDATLQVLLEYGADVNYGSSHRSKPKSALYIAINRREHSLGSISALLSVKDIEINSKADWRGYTALHLAASEGKLDILELLLDHGADINATNATGKTALTLGVVCCPWEKYTQVVRILVEKGTDIDSVDNDGNTALMVAAKHTNQPLEAIEILFDMGAKRSVKNFVGQTALMIAAACGNDLIVEWLLQRRTNSSIEEIWGAVESTIRHDHVKTVRLLLECLSKTAIDDHQNQLSAQLSLEYSRNPRNFDMVSLLEEYGATVTAPTQEAEESWVPIWERDCNSIYP